MFWDDLLAYGPEILWKLNEAAGAVAVDSSGHGRDGTYVNAPTLAQASLIPNRPADTSVRVTAASLQMVQRAHEAWMNGDVFTFGMFYKPATIPAEHDLFGKQERVQVWVEANGALTYYEFDSDWQPLTSAAAVVAAGGTYMIVITCSATERRLFVNGVRKILSTGANPRDSTGNPMQFGHSSTSTTRYANGNMQGCFWISSSLSDAQITALYASSQSAPVPPDAPGAFTVPTLAQVVNNTVTPAWGASTNSPDSYTLEYTSDNGASWHAVVAGNVPTNYVWDTTLFDEGAYRLRVKGVNAYGSSGWTESPNFTIDHVGAIGAFTEPLAGETYYSTIIHAAWGAAAGATTYRVERQLNGGAWVLQSAAAAVTHLDIDSSLLASGSYKLRVRGEQAHGQSEWIESGAFDVVHLDPGLNFLDDGVIFEDLHSGPDVGPRVFDPVTHVATVDGGPDDYTTDEPPNPAIWTPVGPLPDRWLEGHGYSVGSTPLFPLEGFYVAWPIAARENPKHLHAFSGLIFVPPLGWDGTTEPAHDDYVGYIDPVVSNSNLMILQSSMLLDNYAGLFTTKAAMVCLWRNPVNGDALIFDLTYPATLRFYDGTSKTFAGNLAGTLYYPEGVSTSGLPYPPSPVAGHQPYPGSFNSAYDDDLIEVAFSVRDGIITLYFGDVSYRFGVAKFVVDMSAYVNVPGGIAYAWANSFQVGEWRGARAVVADYIEITGLREGWVVRAQQRSLESWWAFDQSVPWARDAMPPTRAAEAVQFAVIEAIAGSDGVARLYPWNPSTRRIWDRSVEWPDVLAELPEDPLLHYTITAPDKWTFDWLTVSIDEDTEVDRYTDPKNVRIGNQFAWGHMDLPAYTPGAFISPVADEVVGAVLPQAITWNEHVPPHPDLEDVEYEVDYTANGVDWVNVRAWAAGSTFDWDHAAFPFSRLSQFRVRARGTASLIPSGYRLSGVFVLYHSVGALVAIESALDELADPITQFSVYLQPATSPDGHKSTRWRITSVVSGELVLDLVAAGSDRAGFWVTGLTEAHKYSYTYALIDYLDVEGEQSAVRDFVTLRLSEFRPHTSPDETHTTQGGDYREYGTGSIDSTTGGIPELLGGGGARLNMSGVDYEQTPAEFPSQTHHLIRFESDDNLFHGGTDYRNGFTAMLVCIPEDLSSRREIMGQPGSLIVWHDALGGLHVTTVTTNNPPLREDVDGVGEVFESANTEFDFSRGKKILRAGEISSIFVGGRDAWFKTEIAVTGVGSPEVRNWEIMVPKEPATDVEFTELYAGVNGEWRRQLIQDVFNGTQRVSDRFKVARPGMFDVGHGSTNADAAGDVEASGRSARMIVRTFAYWNTLLDTATVTTLASFVELGDMQGLWDMIAVMDPRPIEFSKVAEYPKPHKPVIAEVP